MNLLQIRQRFRTMSGRHDLVTALGADSGANFYINEARKYLDRQDETQKSWAVCYRFCEVGHFTVQFPYCRAIKEVWAASMTDGRWQLEKKSLQDITSEYLTEVPSDRDGGAPLYYSPAIGRYIPENAEVGSFEAFAGYVDVMSGHSHEYNSILLSSPVTEKTGIEIRGLFYSMELVADTDENYWSVAHPMLLIMATMRQIEIVNRNTQGVNDWSNAIGIDMMGLGKDLVEELIAEGDEMEG